MCVNMGHSSILILLRESPSISFIIMMMMMMMGDLPIQPCGDRGEGHNIVGPFMDFYVHHTEYII